MTVSRIAMAILLSRAALAGPEAPARPSPASDDPLAGTKRRLAEIQSMDDAVGISRPEDPNLYTMRLNADGTVDMRLGCNRANGTWSAEAGPERSSGRFELGPLAATRALCPPPRLDERVTAEARYFRSDMPKDGRLYLSLVADGGTLENDSPPGGGREPCKPRLSGTERQPSPSRFSRWRRWPPMSPCPRSRTSWARRAPRWRWI